MKKILVMSAFMAFSAAFVACSNENDLVQQKPEVPEETTVGYPMHVTVADTRGTDLTKATLPGFTMYSAMQKDNSTAWQTGVAFTNNNGNCSKVTQVDTDFPDETTNYTFYAVSDPGNYALDGESHPIKPTFGGENVSFGYVVPTDYTTYEDGEEIKAANITGGQKDLLVATATSNGASGEVSLTFDHALALVSKVYIRANSTRIQTTSDDELSAEGLNETYEFKVGDNMSICNVNTTGTYTFGTGWSAQNTLGEFVIPITESAFYPFSDSWHEITLSANDNGLYLLPQTLNGTLTDNNNGTYTLSGAYIKVGLQVFAKGSTYDGDEDRTGEYYMHQWWPSGVSAGINTDSDEHSGEAGFRPFCVPLQFTMLPNKTYALWVDLTRGCIFGGDEKYWPLFDSMVLNLN